MSTLAPALLVALLVAGCGRAEPAEHDAGERSIPAAEAQTPVMEPTREDPEPPTGTDGVEEAEGDPERGGAEARLLRDDPAATTREVAGEAPEAGLGGEDRVRVGAESQEARSSPLDRSPTPGESVRTDPAPTTPPPPPERVRETIAVPAGALLELEMETSLSTERSRPGDRFWATVTEDVLGANGLVLVPRGARVRGRVLESSESPGSDRPAVLTLLAEDLVTAEWARPLRASVVESEMTAEERASDAETAGKIGVGAAAGAVLGKIIGGKGKDALKGAAAGAAAGAVVALATRDGHASIGEGARLVLRLDEPIVLY